MQFKNIDHLLDDEVEKSVKWFWDTASNTDKNSVGYGLILDRSNDENLCSIASVGWGLASFVIGVERKILNREEVLERAIGTLKTVLNLKHYNGFLPHFFTMDTAEMRKGAEYSTIDTALFLQGAMVVEEYFKDETLSKLVDEFYERINWKWISFKAENNSTYFRMAYQPDKTGDYASGKDDGFVWHWSMPAEQLMMYFQAAGQKDFDANLAKELYLGFQRTNLTYEGINYISTQRNALFMHQFSHAYIDFRNLRDMYGFDWYKNSVNATKVAIKFAELNPLNIKGLNKHAWGMSASDGPRGYQVGGQPPFNNGIMTKENAGKDWAIQPYSMLGSLPFLPEEVKQSIWWTIQNHPKTYGEHGFFEAYQQEDVEGTWYGHTYLGIDKGISTVMIDNYQNGTVWKHFMNSKYTKRAITKLNFTEL